MSFLTDFRDFPTLYQHSTTSDLSWLSKTLLILDCPLLLKVHIYKGIWSQRWLITPMLPLVLCYTPTTWRHRLLFLWLALYSDGFTKIDVIRKLMTCMISEQSAWSFPYYTRIYLSDSGSKECLKMWFSTH